MKIFFYVVILILITFVYTQDENAGNLLCLDEQTSSTTLVNS